MHGDLPAVVRRQEPELTRSVLLGIAMVVLVAALTLAIDEAVAELRAEAGRQFDPRVVTDFLAVLEERPWE